MKSLFYIEREKFLCEMAQLISKDHDCECYTFVVSSSNKLLDNLYLLKQMAPKVILFDIKSVGPSLSELIEARNNYNSQIPIIATGHGEDFESIEESLQRSIHSFVSKPLSSSSFLKVIKN